MNGSKHAAAPDLPAYILHEISKIRAEDVKLKIEPCADWGYEEIAWSRWAKRQTNDDIAAAVIAVAMHAVKPGTELYAKLVEAFRRLRQNVPVNPVKMIRPSQVGIAMIAAERAENFILPTVGGRTLNTSLNVFERSCLVHIERLQHGLGDYDGAILGTFSEAVRLAREYADSMQMGKT